MKRNLEELLLLVDDYEIFGSKNILVSGISDDSRKAILSLFAVKAMKSRCVLVRPKFLGVTRKR